MQLPATLDWGLRGYSITASGHSEAKSSLLKIDFQRRGRHPSVDFETSEIYLQTAKNGTDQLSIEELSVCFTQDNCIRRVDLESKVSDRISRESRSERKFQFGRNLAQNEAHYQRS